MKRLLTLLCLLNTCLAFSQTPPLPDNQAFQLSVAVRDDQTVLLKWQIAPGHYLYRKKFHFSVIAPKGGQLSQALMPASLSKTTANQKKYAVYSNTVIIPIPVIQPQGQAIALKVGYQGCSDQGYCYPPTIKRIAINLATDDRQFSTEPIEDSHLPSKNATPLDSKPRIKTRWQGQSIVTWMLGFLGFGLLIAFTPCVLPMIPILSAIITGQKKITTGHAIGLSGCYVLGMALTYAIAGVIIGLIGTNLQTALQAPWAILMFSLIFVAMALSLFGLYPLELPQRWRAKLAKTSQHQKHGSYFGTLLMGVFSTLILSPCVTPPLIGILSFIGQTGQVMIGAMALFIMGIGMGLPLLLVGFSHGKLLPKCGAWMNTIKTSLGILMLATALWMLQRILNDMIMIWLWASLSIGAALYFSAFSSATKKPGMIKKGLGLIIFIYGILLVINAITHHTDPLQPLSFLSQTKKTIPAFIPVKTIADINQQLSIADKKNKVVLLDFYADWCIACKEMDHFTFSNAMVRQALKPFIVLRVDVTKNDQQDKALMKRFHVIAPPTFIFLKKGCEIKKSRLVGESAANDFIRHLNVVRKMAAVSWPCQSRRLAPQSSSE